MPVKRYLSTVYIEKVDINGWWRNVRPVAAGLDGVNQRVRFPYEVRTGVDYHLTRKWIVTGEYQCSRNDSNLDDFDYTSNRFAARLERLF